MQRVLANGVKIKKVSTAFEVLDAVNVSATTDGKTSKTR